MNERIIVVEDDQDILEVLSLYIENAGFQLYKATTIAEGERAILNHKPDVIVLDVNLPDGTGFDLAAKIRNKTDAILIFLTVNETIDYKLLGFEVGADDYMTKPFIPKELIVRIQAHLKRRSPSQHAKILTFDNLEIHLDEKEVYVGGEHVNLFTKEKQLLFYLVEHRDRVVSAEQILDEIWGYDGVVDPKTLSVHISTLRRKIGDSSTKPKWIQTVRGFGYKFIP